MATAMTVAMITICQSPMSLAWLMAATNNATPLVITSAGYDG